MVRSNSRDTSQPPIAPADAPATGATTSKIAADDEEYRTISGLYSAYVSSHNTLSLEQFRDKLLRGVAVWEDLDLVLAERVLPQLKELRANIDNESPIRTRELQEMLDRLLSLTLEDGLTGLFNRRYFDHRLGQELQRAQRERTPCSIMLVDIDDFKQVNDRFGHDAGDRMLQHVSQLLRGCLRASDEITARVGGEEFAIILPNTGADYAPSVAERLRARIGKTALVEAHAPELKISISIGVATAPAASELSAGALVKRADVALYRAKHGGKNKVCVFDELSPERSGDKHR
jgi:diguanylate cyclase (GGDEF)-like protein